MRDGDEARTVIFDGEGAWPKKERIGESSRSWSSVYWLEISR